jgi:PmbA protein
MDYMQFAQDVVSAAMKAGAHEAEAYIQAGSEFSVDVRMDEVETLTQASSKGLGLRVFVDKRMAFASTTDFGAETVADMAKSTAQMAKAASRDKHNGLPDVGPGPLAHLDLYDTAVADLHAERGIEMAREAERAAFAFDPRITNSEGGGFGGHCVTKVIANSNGILYSYSGTSCGLSCTPMAERNGEKQISYYWSSKRFLDELDPPGDVGRQAAIRAVQKLGARKVETQKVPVVFNWMVAGGWLSSIFQALDGDDVHRGLSFLKKKLGKKIASPLVTIIDDPLMSRGLASMPFDGEGVITRRKVVVDGGVLNMYFYDAYTARKYGEQPTGNARRSYGSTPSVSPTNLYLQPTNTDPADIIRGISNGFYVTETMGHGANIVTGDLSVGASGMWIRDGELAFPVQEVTIAGNMLDMLGGIEEVGNDINRISSVVSPTIKIAEMTVSGT